MVGCRVTLGISGTGPRPGMEGGQEEGPRLAAGEGAWRSPEHSAKVGLSPRCAYPPAARPGGAGVWARLPRGVQKPFHMNQKTAEASLTLPCLAVDQELPGTASTLNFP